MENDNRTGLDEQFMRVSKVIAQYYKGAPVELTEDVFKQWIEALDEPMKSGFLRQGFEQAKNALPFRRFALELNDYGMRDYMRENLTKEDFQYYKNTFEKT